MSDAANPNPLVKTMDKSHHDKPLPAKEEHKHEHLHHGDGSHETHKTASKKGHHADHKDEHEDAAHAGHRHPKNEPQPKTN
jgi:hypothetical protein